MRSIAVRGQAVENGTLEAQVHSLAVEKALDSQRKRLIRETGLRFRPYYNGGGGCGKRNVEFWETWGSLQPTLSGLVPEFKKRSAQRSGRIEEGVLVVTNRVGSVGVFPSI